ncbi:MAG: hypothetical protein ACOC0B_01040 [bacterium]
MIHLSISQERRVAGSIGTRAYAERLSEMRERLQDWMRHTNDPLLDGELTPPDGYRLNPVDGPSPNADDTYIVRNGATT